MVYEELCKPQTPDYMNLTQFEGLATKGKLRFEALTKGDYVTIFKEYAKIGNKSMMNINHF